MLVLSLSDLVPRKYMRAENTYAPRNTCMPRGMCLLRNTCAPRDLVHAETYPVVDHVMSRDRSRDDPANCDSITPLPPLKTSSLKSNTHQCTLEHDQDVPQVPR